MLVKIKTKLAILTKGDTHLGKFRVRLGKNNSLPDHVQYKGIIFAREQGRGAVMYRQIVVVPVVEEDMVAANLREIPEG